jgi:uncharacterized membrane protein YeaQ/YmgE (transglycosylase-associated protein family)
MNTEQLALFLLIGLVAGWLASRITRGRGFGLIGDLVVGVIGAYLGGWMFNQLGISMAGIFGSLVTAVIGASVLLYVLRILNKA